VAWIVWEERTTVTWRIPIAAGWVVASPFAASSGLSLGLNRRPLVELVLHVALAVEAWRPGREREPALTGKADLRSQAPA